MLGQQVAVLAPLASSDYRKLWIGQTVSVIGDKLDQVALAILVYHATGSMLQMGIALAFTALPAALFSLPAGAFVDRWDRRWTMVVADLLRAGLVLAVPFVADTNIFAVYGIAFAVATVSLFFEPAKMSLIPDLVSEEQLMAANSLEQASSAGAELLGLAIGGLAVAALGWRVAFIADAGTYLISALFILSIRARTSIPTEPLADRNGFVREIVEGVRYIWRAPVLRDLTGVYALTALGGAAMITLAHLLALWTYEGGSIVLALLDAAITIGLLAGSLLVGSVTGKSAGRTFLTGVLLFGMLCAGLSFATTVQAALPLLLLLGVANMWFLVPMVTLLQEQSDRAMRGRVFAARMAVGRLAAAIGLVGAGALAQEIGVQPVIALTGLIIAIAGVAGFTRPILRNA